MNSASGHLFLPKNKYQESQMKFEKIVMNVPVNKDLLTGTHPVNKELLTGTFRSIASSKINDRSRYSFYSPTLISVWSPPPKNE